MSGLRSWGPRAAVTAAITWALLGVDSVLRPGEHHERDLFLFLPWLLTMVALAEVHRRQRHEDRAGERRAFRAVLATMTLVALGQVGVVLDVGPLTALAFPTGPLLWIVAMVPFGVATFRAGVLPRRVGIAIALLEPGSIVTGVLLAPVAGLADRGAYSGALEKGAVLALIAAALLAGSRQPVPTVVPTLQDA
jgi:hypothetical protein